MTSRPSPDIAETYRRGGLWVAVMVMATWHLFSTLPAVMGGWVHDGLAASGAVTWLAWAITGAISAILVLRGGGRGIAWPLAVCLILLAGVAIAPFDVRTGFFDHYDWQFSAAGWFALVALWNHKLRFLLAFFAASTAISAAALVALDEADRLGIARFVNVSCSVWVLEITIFVGSGVVAATARQMAEAEKATAQIRTAQLAAEAVQTARRTRYESLRETVAGLLEGLAAGAIDLSQPATRQRIAVAATRLRSYFPARGDSGDPLWQDLEACADTAQRRGVAVDLIAPAGTIPPLPVDARRALIEPVAQVLAAPPTWARVTLIASPAQVALAVVADASVGSPMWARHPLVRVDHDSGEGRLWVQAQWTGQLPSRSSMTRR